MVGRATWWKWIFKGLWFPCLPLRHQYFLHMGSVLETGDVLWEWQSLWNFISINIFILKSLILLLLFCIADFCTAYVRSFASNYNFLGSGNILRSCTDISHFRSLKNEKLYIVLNSWVYNLFFTINKIKLATKKCAGMAQWVLRLATGWTVRE